MATLRIHNKRRHADSAQDSFAQLHSAQPDKLLALVGPAAAALWLVGGSLVVAYLASAGVLTNEPSAWVLIGCCIAGAVISVAMPWQRISRVWLLPLDWAALAVIASAVALLDRSGISAFYLLPMIFLTYFFWDQRNLVVFHVVSWIIIFSGAEFLREGPVASEQLIVALPTYILAALLVGLLADRFRQANLTEQTRFRATVEALCTALSARDGYTGEHSAETLELVMSVAHELGLSRSQKAYLSDVALLHDIGKIGVPNDVLHHDGALDDSQWAVMRQHPVIGERIVARVPGLEEVAHAIRHEHERWDGDGYPDGLVATEIPIASRIVLACDAYHAMTSDRPYRRAMPLEEARHELVKHAGTQFDPAVVGALLAALEKDRLGEDDGHAVAIGSVTELPAPQSINGNGPLVHDDNVYAPPVA